MAQNNFGTIIDGFVALSIMLLLVVLGYACTIMERPHGWLTAPGLFPLISSILGFVSFGAIAFNAAREYRMNLTLPNIAFRSALSSWIRTATVHNFLKIVLSIAVYYFILLHILPFELSTLLFLISVQYQFSPNKYWPKILLISLLATITITIAFRGAFGVLLPGEFDMLGNLLFWINHQ